MYVCMYVMNCKHNKIT